MDAQGWRRRAAIFRDDIGDQAFTDRRLIAHHHGARAHSRMACEHGLDFAGLDTITANLYLTVDASDKFDRAIGQVAHQIAGAIQTLGRIPERIRHEALAVSSGRPQITTRNASSTDVQLADHANRHQSHALVQDVQRGVGYWPSDRDRVCVGGQIAWNAIGCRERRAFGWPVGMENIGVRQCIERSTDVTD